MEDKNILKETGVILVAAFMIISTITVTGNTVNEEIKSICSWPERGITLIADGGNNRVIEVADNGTIMWECSTLQNHSYDAERLDNGNTLITCCFFDAISGEFYGHVIEVDYDGITIWNYSNGLRLTCDAERLDNGNTLISSTDNHRVIEVDINGNVVWEMTGADVPYDAERLDNGNTLVADVLNKRVIEVDINGTVVWEYSTGLYFPSDVERLSNGNTLITDRSGDFVIEVDINGIIIWEKTGLREPWDAERLDNGNTLITDSRMDRVIEVDINGTVVWDYSTGMYFPFDVERLNRPPYTPVVISPFDGATEIDINVDFSWKGGDPDPGNTVTYDVYFDEVNPPNYYGTTGPHTGDPSYVIAYDLGTLDFLTTYYWNIVAIDNHGASTESSIWSFTTLENGPPSAPRINGPTSGKPDNTYSYAFVSEDPDGDDVFYEIDWGDGQVDPWDGPHKSNSVITKSHSWDEQGTFNISARAKDVYDVIGEWGTLDVNIPKNKPSTFNFNFLGWFLDHFPLLEKLLSLIRMI